jgi:hypothetical protein
MKKIIWFLLPGFFACLFAKAQVDIYNGGILFLSTGTDTLFINGNFTNTAAAAFTNHGMIQVKQDIINDQAAMPTGTGTLYLNGNITQSINGSQTFKTFHLFSNNNSGIALNNNLSVSGVHHFVSGMISTSATPNFMIYEPGSSYTGDDDSKHVNGWVKKTGNSDFIFPVGNGTYERTIALTNLTASSEFDIRHNGAVTPDRYSLFPLLVYVDSAEYWTINKISGSAAQVAMNWDNSKVPFPNLMLSDIRVAYYDGVFWRSIGGAATGNVFTTGNITSGSVSAFNSNFTFGSISIVLPLKIINFTAARMNDHTRLNWTIGNELNVEKYMLQRSDDGIVFYTVSEQLPYNRNGTEFYSYDDWKTLNGTVYYRLKVTSPGVPVKYSQTISVSENDSRKQLYVITNPVDEKIDVYADAVISGVYNYSIAAMGGQVMQTGKLEIKNTGTYTIHLKSAFATGAYLLVVQNETTRLQKTIIKK